MKRHETLKGEKKQTKKDNERCETFLVELKNNFVHVAYLARKLRIVKTLFKWYKIVCWVVVDDDDS